MTGTTGGPGEGLSRVDGCDLCEAARITPWFHEDEWCWIAECEICAVPMVVWRFHGTDPPAEHLSHMHTHLARVAGDTLTVEVEVLESRPSAKRPDRGSARLKYTTFNQAGEPVQSFVALHILKRRPD